MKLAESNGLNYYYDPIWDARYPVLHGFFGRVGGVSPTPYSSLNTGPLTGDSRINISKNLTSIASIFTLPRERIFSPLQVHGSDILRVTAASLPRSVVSCKDPLRGDALITDEAGILLGILTADCLPLLIVDPCRPAVAAVHAGWRGTLQGIAAKTVIRLVETFGTNIEDYRIAMGPVIGPCCYTVGEEVVQAFLEKSARNEDFIRPASPGQWLLNLERINQHQLAQLGVPEDNISPSPACTRCRDDLFFSVRAQEEPTGRQLALVGIKRPKE